MLRGSGLPVLTTPLPRSNLSHIRLFITTPRKQLIFYVNWYFLWSYFEQFSFCANREKKNQIPPPPKKNLDHPKVKWHSIDYSQLSLLIPWYRLSICLQKEKDTMVPALQIRIEDFIARFWLALYLSGLQFLYINRLYNHDIKIFYPHTKMFSSFRSLCTTSNSWMWTKPSMICFAQWQTFSTLVAFSDLPGVDSSSLKMWFLKFPLHFSMTKMTLVLIGLLISRYMP